MKAHLLGSIRMTVVMTALLGFAYPAVVWGVGRLAFREEAGGGFLRMNESPGAGGRIVGSALLGQSFHSKRLFHSRPSSAGDAGYDATASSGSNLGPTSKKLADSIGERVASLRSENPTASGSPLPSDSVTSSGSGLDPHISPEYARLQIPRVAHETKMPAADLGALVVARTEGRFLGLWGAPRVNVLRLNLDLVHRGAAP
jgi:potassium-transporting ATPase KdpC subunit